MCIPLTFSFRLEFPSLAPFGMNGHEINLLSDRAQVTNVAQQLFVPPPASENDGPHVSVVKVRRPKFSFAWLIVIGQI